MEAEVTREDIVDHDIWALASIISHINDSANRVSITKFQLHDLTLLHERLGNLIKELEQ